MRNNRPLNKFVLAAIAAVKDYIDMHRLERKTINELAIYGRINRIVLQKSFKEIYGKRIKKYQIEKRMEIACEMLKEDLLNKKEIAIKCGYSKQNNFSSDFRKVYNMSPTEWQNGNS